MNPEAQQAVANALQQFQQGVRDPAIEQVRAYADQGEPVAASIIAWMFQQMGEPRWREAIPYARTALEQGQPWAINYVLGNMLNAPDMRGQLVELMRLAMDSGWQVDPIGQAMMPLQQGDLGTAVAMMGLAEGPHPWPPSGWDQFVNGARTQAQSIGQAASEVAQQRERAMASIEQSTAAIGEHETSLRTRTQRLLKLIEQTTSAQVQDFFDQEAAAYGTEAGRLWRWGVVVLSVAAFIAVLPVTIYYVAKVFGHTSFASKNIVAAHFAPAIALGAIAGVLLARARGRDRARQRAKDLSVALATMFVYSDQIANEDERQVFVREMGRTIIESFLASDGGGGGDDSTNLLSAVLRSR